MSWLDTLRIAFFNWTLRPRRDLDHRASRRQRRFCPGLEKLEEREVLSSTLSGLENSATLTGLVQMREEAATSSIRFVNGGQQPQAEAVARVHTLLGQVVEQAENRLGQSLGAAHDLFDTLMHDAGAWLNDVASQWGLDLPPFAPSDVSGGNAPRLPAMNGAMPPPAQTKTANNSLAPGGDPPIPFVEGVSSGQVLGTFTDSDGNTDPTKSTASIDWGNSQQTTGFVTYSNGQFQIYGTMTYAEEGNYPITVTVTDQDGDITTVTASAAVSDAALTTGAVYGFSATAGQATPVIPFVNFSDGNTSAPASDFTTEIDWGDGQVTPGTVNSTGNGNFTVAASHTYALPGGYAVNVVIADKGGSETSASTSADVSASTTLPAAYDDSYSVNHDNALTVPATSGVLVNDTDPNNLPLSAVLVSNAAHGTINFNSDGSFTYTPNAGYIGADSFTYYASNGQYNSNTATVSLAVLSTISGQVWLDGNQDGIENNGEMGMAGVTVNLVTPNGAPVTSTTTDANGNYQLSVDPSLGSEFQVQVDIPDGDSATIPFASTSGIVSSIDDAGYSNLLTLPASGGISNVNAGIASGTGPLASISGEAWLDSNDDGILATGELGLQAINVNLLDGNGNIVDSTSTDANGDYSFFGLSPNSPYTVQFVGPNGYVFSPQNVGSPSTSSSAGANGSTAPITLSPGQNLATVNAGLYGSAPIVYQTNVAMTAENDSYTGMDFTADGFDPNGEPLTPVILQAPTYGSLIYNTSTGLYDYTAPSNYTGLDSFQYELSDGHAVSDVASVQILAYSGIIQPGVYDNFPAMQEALFDGNGGQPSQSSIKEGKGMLDCWFVAAAAGLAQQDPNKIVNMIQYNAKTDTYKVTFPGHAPTFVTGFEHDGHTYSDSNGDWLAVLEKAYGQMIYNQKWVTWDNIPYDYINRTNSNDTGIEALTGHSTNTDSFQYTRDSTTRTNLTNAFANNKVVVAGTGGSSLSAAELKAIGLAYPHSYAVVAYNATTDQVRLYNPWGRNPVFNKGGDPRFFLGKNDPENPTHAQTGYFWMSLTEFTNTFGFIDYEE